MLSKIFQPRDKIQPLDQTFLTIPREILNYSLSNGLVELAKDCSVENYLVEIGNITYLKKKDLPSFLNPEPKSMRILSPDYLIRSTENIGYENIGYFKLPEISLRTAITLVGLENRIFDKAEKLQSMQNNPKGISNHRKTLVIDEPFILEAREFMRLVKNYLNVVGLFRETLAIGEFAEIIKSYEFLIRNKISESTPPHLAREFGKVVIQPLRVQARGY
jgi:hypothetical protein